jgi:hypothetical protein
LLTGLNLVPTAIEKPSGACSVGRLLSTAG